MEKENWQPYGTYFRPQAWKATCINSGAKVSPLNHGTSLKVAAALRRTDRHNLQKSLLHATETRTSPLRETLVSTFYHSFLITARDRAPAAFASTPLLLQHTTCKWHRQLSLPLPLVAVIQSMRARRTLTSGKYRCFP